MLIDDHVLLMLALSISLAAQITSAESLTFKKIIELVLSTLSIALPVAVHLIDNGYSRDYMIGIMVLVGLAGEGVFKQLGKSIKKEGLLKRLVDAVLKKH